MLVIWVRSRFWGLTSLLVIKSLMSLLFLNTSKHLSFLAWIREFSVSNIWFDSGFAPLCPVSFSMLKAARGAESSSMSSSSESRAISSLREFYRSPDAAVVAWDYFDPFPPMLPDAFFTVIFCLVPCFPVWTLRFLTDGCCTRFALSNCIEDESALGGLSYLFLAFW